MEKRTVNFIMNDNDKSVCAELQETYLRMRAELEATAQKFCRCVTDMEKLSMSTTVTSDKAHWNKVISMDAQMQSLNAMFVHNVCTYLENRYRVTICRNDIVNELINDSAMARSLTSKQVVEKASAYTIIKSRIKANPAEKTKQISVAEIFVPQPATAENKRQFERFFRENIETFREGTFVTEPVDTVSVKN